MKKARIALAAITTAAFLFFVDWGTTLAIQFTKVYWWLKS